MSVWLIMTALYQKLVNQKAVLTLVKAQFVEIGLSAKLNFINQSVTVHLVSKEMLMFPALRLDVDPMMIAETEKNVIICLGLIKRKNVNHFVLKVLAHKVLLVQLQIIKKTVPAIILCKGMAIQLVMSVRPNTFPFYFLKINFQKHITEI